VLRAQKLIPDDLQVLDSLLDRAALEVYEGALSPGQGTAIASLVGARVRLREIALKIWEQQELEGRMARLEEHIEELGIKSGRNGARSIYPLQR
jgi:hypothetical protein